MWGLGDISCENGNIPFLSLYIFDIAVVYIKIYVFSMSVHLSVKYDEELNRLGSVSVEMSRTGTRSYSGFRVILVCLLPFYFPTVCCRSWLDILIVSHFCHLFVSSCSRNRNERYKLQPLFSQYKIPMQIRMYCLPWNHMQINRLVCLDIWRLKFSFSILKSADFIEACSQILS